MGYLIDSCLFIRQERSQHSVSDFLKRHAGEAVAISAVTAAELLHGVFRAQNRATANQRKAFVEMILGQMPIVDFDVACARIYAEIWAQLAEKGQRVSAHDLQIGATALRMGYGLLTYNKKDFIRIPGLKVIVPEM